MSILDVVFTKGMSDCICALHSTVFGDTLKCITYDYISDSIDRDGRDVVYYLNIETHMLTMCVRARAGCGASMEIMDEIDFVERGFVLPPFLQRHHDFKLRITPMPLK